VNLSVILIAVTGVSHFRNLRTSAGATLVLSMKEAVSGMICKGGSVYTSIEREVWVGQATWAPPPPQRGAAGQNSYLLVGKN
jgi:hypothetical protein